ncbi:S8 family serine peptidase [Nocardioides speluncae]|uniref:S8 family serine peptidase n=1 Tax=Nocardioides speluncae TaxID=2670337 RepID=UPI0023E81717|nr:S8 family serine peptidase [Nocardioides speluncae]
MPGGDVGVRSGTSMATPHVAGASALYLQSHPDATPATVKWYLGNTATQRPECDHQPPGTANRLL